MSDHRKNHRNVTIVDVARECGVSYSTVSRVLNGFEHVKDTTRERVLEAAEKLGYVANLQARSLAGGRTNLIGLLVPTLDNGYVAEIARGIDESLARDDYELMLYTTHRHQKRETLFVKSIANGLTDGILLMVPLIQSEYLQALHERNFPYVLIDQSDPNNTSNIVDSTNWQGAYDAAEYLIQKGHRKVAHITGLRQLSSARERLTGYKAALSAHDIPVNTDYIVDGDFMQPSGYEGMQQLLTLDDRPTAVFAANDLSAFGAMNAIRDAGLSIPDDISVIGFDDIPQAAIVTPKLTTIRQPLHQMGVVAAQMLLDIIEKPDRPLRRTTLSTRLIERESVKSV